MSDTRLDRIEKNLEEISHDLKEHMRRSLANEAAVTILRAEIKLIHTLGLGLGAISTIVYTILRLWKL